MTRIRIGTSGYVYPHWRGPFYLPSASSSEMLELYRQRFDTVEINNSFYRLPSAEVFTRWREAVPPGFIYAVKANRFITHMKKLKDPEEPVARMMSRVELLGDRLGPILFQLPPRWRVNVERLEALLAALPPQYRYTFELRDPTWFDDRVYAALAEHRAAFCIWDLSRQLSPLVVTTDLVYVRLHGPGDAYQGSYDDATLALWAERFAGWAAEGREVYCYFDNDQAGYAVHDALRIRAMLVTEDG